MLKKIIIHVRYPYAAGVIATVWIGTAILASIDEQAPVTAMLALSAFATLVIAPIGFSNPRK